MKLFVSSSMISKLQQQNYLPLNKLMSLLFIFPQIFLLHHSYILLSYRGLRCIHAPWHCFPSHTVSDAKFISYPVKITELTVPQMLLLRKLSLLKLTAVMERFSPSNRTGWSWAVPKFIRRIRSPDYKGSFLSVNIYKMS